MDYGRGIYYSRRVYIGQYTQYSARLGGVGLQRQSGQPVWADMSAFFGNMAYAVYTGLCHMPDIEKGA